ncbi:Leucine-rich repeat extensin-like protein 6 [Prunus dulcis]|uniref:Leucine-rich repeat extensin-like protein 6 n=1 Tax=Prunus dulcis TaxID=3755 RepID=A0A4Y1RF97_PRUDU|nr:Leucine-rich repeat extensin-like protein 6 [Prunus dulcis]
MSAPATAGPETGPVRLASSPDKPARFPRRKPRTPAASSTGSNRNCSAVAPPPPPPKPVIEPVVAPGSVQVVYEVRSVHLSKSCRLAELEQEARSEMGAESSTSISVTPSFTTSTFASTIPTCGDNALDMRHVLSQFTRTMATALRGRRGTESSEIKRVKELGAKNLWAVQTQQKQNYGLLMWKEFLRFWNVQLRIESAWLPFYSRAMLIIGGSSKKGL